MNLLGKCDKCGKVRRVKPYRPSWGEDWEPIYQCEECEALGSYWVIPSTFVPVGKGVDTISHPTEKV